MHRSEGALWIVEPHLPNTCPIPNPRPGLINRPAQSAWLDPADDETKLIHMSEQHDARPVPVAFSRGDQIAQSIRRSRKAKTTHFRRESSAPFAKPLRQRTRR